MAATAYRDFEFVVDTEAQCRAHVGGRQALQDNPGPFVDQSIVDPAGILVAVIAGTDDVTGKRRIEIAGKGLGIDWGAIHGYQCSSNLNTTILEIHRFIN